MSQRVTGQGRQGPETGSGMHNKLKDRRIRGAALEMIMKDVLEGMVDFTHDTCAGSDTAGLEIVTIEKARTVSRRPSNIVRFPRPPKTR